METDKMRNTIDRLKYIYRPPKLQILQKKITFTSRGKHSQLNYPYLSRFNTQRVSYLKDTQFELIHEGKQEFAELEFLASRFERREG